jgi:hypothetical protein
MSVVSLPRFRRRHGQWSADGAGRAPRSGSLHVDLAG